MNVKVPDMSFIFNPYFHDAMDGIMNNIDNMSLLYVPEIECMFSADKISNTIYNISIMNRLFYKFYYINKELQFIEIVDNNIMNSINYKDCTIRLNDNFCINFFDLFEEDFLFNIKIQFSTDTEFERSLKQLLQYILIIKQRYYKIK